jgi:biotin carboxyl carrier protein
VAVVSDPRVVKKIGPGTYRVETDGRGRIVYVAGPASNRWAFCDGEVFRVETAAPARRGGSRGHVAQSLTSPMPATVLKVRVAPGAAVKKGDTVVVLEAMKMELPVRAPADATVTAVNCREGEIVQPDTVLVELE